MDAKKQDRECLGQHGRHCWRFPGMNGHVHNDCKECHTCGISRAEFEAVTL